MLRLDVQDVGFAEPALARSVDSFLGQSSGGSQGSGSDLSFNGGGSAINGRRSADQTLDDVNFRIRDLHEIAAGLMFNVHDGDTGAFGLRLLAGRGRAEIYLPDGVDIFVDPITVTARTRFVEASVMAEHTLPWPGIFSNRVAITAEAGHRLTRSRVSLRSALIRRDDTGTDNQTFGGVGLRVDLGPDRATRLDLGLRRIRGTASIGRLGLERDF